MDNNVKEAFSKVKQDMTSISGFLQETYSALDSLKQELKSLSDELAILKLKELSSNNEDIKPDYGPKIKQLESSLESYKQEIEKKLEDKKKIEVNINELKKEPELDIIEQEWKDYKNKVAQQTNTPTQNPTHNPTHQETTENKQYSVDNSDIKEYIKQAVSESISELKEQFSSGNGGVPTHSPTDNPTHPTQTPTQPSFPVEESYQQSPNQPKIAFSTRNEGVPTQNPTHQPTHQHKTQQQLNEPQNSTEVQIKLIPNLLDNLGEETGKLLASLDSIKKEYRLKFKRLTRQEMLIFSTLYSLEEAGEIEIDHDLLSKKLNLSPSSIRDYINRLIEKGIPIKKSYINNKKVILNVSEELKKIASLSTIIKLKEL
jgi:DNA-binding MarR family transcriptional regulator